MKKLRKQFPDKKIRYFHCGEYGENFGRPHYHACLFGLDFDDKQLWKIQNGVNIYTSQILADIWGKGFVTVGDVTFESAAYVARYIMKKITGEKSLDHYAQFDRFTGELKSYRDPEYTTMSRRPGIAHNWFKQYGSDIYPSDNVVLKNRKMRPPKYYDGLYEIENPTGYDEIKLKRTIHALENKDNTQERLAVKEKCCEAKLQNLPRKIQ